VRAPVLATQYVISKKGFYIGKKKRIGGLRRYLYARLGRYSNALGKELNSSNRMSAKLAVRHDNIHLRTLLGKVIVPRTEDGVTGYGYQ